MVTTETKLDRWKRQNELPAHTCVDRAYMICAACQQARRRLRRDTVLFGLAVLLVIGVIVALWWAGGDSNYDYLPHIE